MIAAFFAFLVFVLFLISCALFLVSTVWMWVEGARVSIFWLIAMLVFPVSGFLFLLLHFDRSRGWFAAMIAGCVAFAMAYMLALPF